MQRSEKRMPSQEYVFEDEKITKILTVETSGIAIAMAAASAMHIPVVFAKKSKSINLDGEMCHAEVESFTHKNTNTVIVSKKFLNENDLSVVCS